MFPLGCSGVLTGLGSLNCLLQAAYFHEVPLLSWLGINALSVAVWKLLMRTGISDRKAKRSCDAMKLLAGSP